jgi:uncharacterized protein (TIGR03067 family)
LAVLLLSAVAGCGAQEQASVQGTWTPVSSIRGGRETPKEQLGRGLATFEGDLLTMSEEDDKETSKFTLDTGKTPAQIDIVPLEGPDKGQTVRGIVEVSGDKLRLCFSRPGGDRPTVFSSKEGEKTYLIEFTRATK